MFKSSPASHAARFINGEKLSIVLHGNMHAGYDIAAYHNIFLGST
jgi:hypothetical protein